MGAGRGARAGTLTMDSARGYVAARATERRDCLAWCMRAIGRPDELVERLGRSGSNRALLTITESAISRVNEDAGGP